MSATRPRACLLTPNETLRQQADALRQQFDLDLVTTPPVDGYYLCLNEHGLQLQLGGRPPARHAIRIDFVGGVLSYRRRFGGGRGQPLARAVGMRPGFSPTVWDATAGLGRDGFVLASLGSHVTLCERSPILAALLQDALQRARGDTEIGAWVAERLRLVPGDSVDLLQQLAGAQRPDVVYLDPMYPPGKKHVLVKKDIRAVRELLGPDRAAGALLEVARQSANRRVVVKRPRRAGWLDEKRPDSCIESKKTRYDIYLTL